MSVWRELAKTAIKLFRCRRAIFIARFWAIWHNYRHRWSPVPFADRRGDAVACTSAGYAKNSEGRPATAAPFAFAFLKNIPV